MLQSAFSDTIGDRDTLWDRIGALVDVLFHEFYHLYIYVYLQFSKLPLMSFIPNALDIVLKIS